MLLLFCDVAFWKVEIPELQEDTKLVWVSESEGEYFDCTHGCGEMEGTKGVSEGPDQKYKRKGMRVRIW
jgi:hypothetical protein